MKIRIFICLFVFSFIALAATNYPIPAPSTSGNVMSSNGYKWTSSGTIATSAVPTNIPAGSISSGTLATARIGTYIGSVAASQVDSGTLAVARVPVFTALSPSNTKGMLITSDGTTNVALAVGTNTHVLTADSTTANGIKWAAASGGVTNVAMTVPSFLTVSGSPITSTGTLAVTLTSNNPLPVANGGTYSTGYTVKTANATLGVSDSGFIYDTSGGAYTVTLPTAVGADGKEYTIMIRQGSNILTVATTSSQTISGEASGAYKLASRGDSLIVVSDGANWQVKHYGVRYSVNARKTTAQVISNTTETDVSFATEDEDPLGSWSTPTFTAQLTGTYFVCARAFFAANATGQRSLHIKKSGTYYRSDNQNNFGGTYMTRMNNCALVHMTTTDTVVIRTYQDSGGNLNLISDIGTTGDATSLSIWFVGKY